jgi:hypothetical protein
MATEMTPEEIEAVFREYNDAVVRGVPIEAALAERMRDASVGLRGYTRDLKQSLERIKTSSIGLARALKNGEQGASVFNSFIESGADAIAAYTSSMGRAGRVLGTIISLGGKLIGAINEQTDALFQGYQDLARFGAGVTTGVDGVMQLSQQMGYTVQTLGSFSGILERSSSQLAMMSGTVETGTRDFARLINSVSDQREMWRRMGLEVDQQNEAYAGFVRIMSLSGRMQRMTDADRTASSQVYLENLVTLGKLTGQTVEEMQSQREALMSQQRFASTQRELARKAQAAENAGDTAAAARYRNQMEQNFQLINAVPEELRTGVADLMTGFVGTSQSALQVYRGLPGMARMIMSQNFEYSEVVAKGEVEAGKRLDAFGRTLGGIGAFDEVFGPLIGFVKLESAAARAAFDERKRAAEAEKELQRAMTGATADQAKLREQQLLTTQNIQGLVGILRGPVTAGMRAVATATGEATTALGNLAGTNQRGAAPGPGAAATPIVPPGTSAAPGSAMTANAGLPAPAPATLNITPPAAAASTVAPSPAAVAPSAGAVNLNMVNIPELVQGGVVSGPTSGYQTMLDGVNAVVPLGSGRTIPVQMPNMTQGTQEQMQAVSQQMSKLDDLIRETRVNNMLTQRLLKVAQA